MRVDLDHVGHRYADGPLLFHDLTASLMPGHVYALTGPSGAGKSTLLGIIAGWTTPAEGQVTRQGIDSMRWIFQNPHGVAQRTAIDHVSLPLLAKGLPRCEAEEQAHAHGPVQPGPGRRPQVRGTVRRRGPAPHARPRVRGPALAHARGRAHRPARHAHCVCFVKLL